MIPEEDRDKVFHKLYFFLPVLAMDDREDQDAPPDMEDVDVVESEAEDNPELLDPPYS